jgi:hypothetical protein
MMLFKVAVQFVDGLLKDVAWFPSLIKRQPKTESIYEGRILPWAMMPLEYYIGMFLKSMDKYPEKDWLARGIFLLNEYYYTLDHSKYVEGMAYLLGSNSETLNHVTEWLEDNGYDTGEYDPE